MNIPKILSIARKASEKSDHPMFKLGCVITDRKGRIYSISSNHHLKTHPIYNRIAPLKTLHAEASAILSIRHKADFSKLHLFVYREYKDGTLALAKPCEYCTKLIKNYGIKNIWYTTPEGLKKDAA